MAFVGKKFPNISVNAMNDMGDTFKINVLESPKLIVIIFSLNIYNNIAVLPCFLKFFLYKILSIFIYSL